MTTRVSGKRGVIRRALDFLFSAVAVVGEIGLVLMMVVMAAEVFTRNALSSSLVIADEASAALLVIVTFLGLSLAVRNNKLFRFDGLVRRIPDGVWRPYEKGLFVAALGVSLILLFYVWRFVASTVRRGTTSDGMIDYPLWIPQIFMPIGAALLVLAILEKLATRPTDAREES